METYFELAGPEKVVRAFLERFVVDPVDTKDAELLSNAVVCGYIRRGKLPLDAFDEFLYIHEDDCEIMAKFKDDDVRGYYNNRCYAFLADDEQLCDPFFETHY